MATTVHMTTYAGVESGACTVELGDGLSLVGRWEAEGGKGRGWTSVILRRGLDEVPLGVAGLDGSSARDRLDAELEAYWQGS